MKDIMLDSVTKIASPRAQKKEQIAFRAPSERTLPLPLAKTVADERATTRMRTASDIAAVAFPRKTMVTPAPWTMPAETGGSQSVRIVVQEDPDADNLTRLFWACAMLLFGVAVGGTIWLAASHAVPPAPPSVAAQPPPPAVEVVPTATVTPPPPATGVVLGASPVPPRAQPRKR